MGSSGSSWIVGIVVEVGERLPRRTPEWKWTGSGAAGGQANRSTCPM